MSKITSDDDFIKELILAMKKKSFEEIKCIIDNYENTQHVNIAKKNFTKSSQKQKTLHRHLNLISSESQETQLNSTQ